MQFYYKSDEELLTDFESWQVRKCNIKEGQDDQNIKHLSKIWDAVDSSHKMYKKNLLGDVGKVDDLYVDPRLLAIREYNSLSESRRQKVPKPEEASTVRNRINVLSRFLDFLESRDIYAGILKKDMVTMRSRFFEFNKQLRILEKERCIVVQEQKQENLITAEELINYGQSEFVQGLNKKLVDLHNGTKTKVTIREATDIRNFLMPMLSTGNGLRSSNLIWLTLDDFSKTIPDDTIANASCMKSKKYKTSFMYGGKYILMDADMKEFLTLYIKHFRPLLINDKNDEDDDRYIFASSREESKQVKKVLSTITGKMEEQKMTMTTSAVAYGMSSTFRKAKVVSVGRSKIISNTLIRASAATIAYSHGLINNVEEFANEFMKNRKDTSQKHYIMKHWSSNVSRKYSMGLYNIFGYCNANDVEKVTVFSSNASEIKKQIDPKEMLNYVQDVLQKISLEVNETVTDEKLVAFFSSDNVQKSVSPPKQSSQSTCSKLHKLPEPMEVQEVKIIC